MRAGNLGVPTTSEWLNGVLAPGSRVGIDPVSKILIIILAHYYINLSPSSPQIGGWWPCHVLQFLLSCIISMMVVALIILVG